MVKFRIKTTIYMRQLLQRIAECFLGLIGAILGSFEKLRKATISFMSVRPSVWKNLAPVCSMSLCIHFVSSPF